MNIIYYCDSDLKFCPVKQYLNRFNASAAKDAKLIAAINSKIIFLSNRENHPCPPISKPLRGYSFFEIRHRKNKNILIRVIYFCCDGKMVLLNAFEKPDDYGSQKIKKGIEKIFDMAEIYRQKYLKNKNLYENY
jgi:hypothetical protein